MEIESKVFHSKINEICFKHGFIMYPSEIAPFKCRNFFYEKTGVRVWMEGDKCYASDEKFLSIE